MAPLAARFAVLEDDVATMGIALRALGAAPAAADIVIKLTKLLLIVVLVCCGPALEAACGPEPWCRAPGPTPLPS